MKIYTTEQVNSIDWESYDVAPLGGEMAEDLIGIINRSAHYITNNWWHHRKYHKLNQQVYITFASSAERAVLPNAQAARLLATAVKFKVLDPAIAKHNYQKTQDKSVKLIRSLCYNYIANMANGWRAISIVAQTACAGMLMWDKLNKRDKMLLVNMLEHSASELLDIKPTFNYYEGKPESGGAVIYHVGFNAERATVLNIAALMLPGHEKASKWAVKSRLFLKTAMSIRDDMTKGSNYTDEATVVTRGNIDAEQMAMMTTALDNLGISTLLGGVPYTDILVNAREVYTAFSNLYIARNKRAWEPLYNVDDNNKPIGVINMPHKSEKNSLMPYLAMDIFAYCLELDTDIEHKAREWAECKMQHIIYKQKSHRSGKYYSSAKGKNLGRESKIGADAAMSYVMLYIKATEGGVAATV